MVSRLLLGIAAGFLCLAPIETLAASTKSAPYSVKTVKPSACPAPTPTGTLQYQTNKTISNQLGGTLALYNGTKSPVQQILYTVTNSSDQGQALINLAYGLRLTVTADDGSALQYSKGANSLTIINAGCKSSQVYTDTSMGSHVESRSNMDVSHNEREERDDRPQVTVTVDLTDYCGYPVSSASPQLACTPVLYPPNQGGSNPVYGEPEYSVMDGGQRGRYVGYCTITDQLSSANHAYEVCQGEVDATLTQAKKLQETADQAKDFLEKLGKVFKAAEKLSKKVAGPLGVWDDMNTVLNLPPVRKQLGMDSCGVPDDISLGIQDTKFSQSIGTVLATPTYITVAAGIPTCVAGGSCSCIPACNAASTCGCVEVDNGNAPPVCTTSGPCSGQSCNTSSDCPSGQSCLTSTCCGGGVCSVPNCPNSRSASSIFAQEQGPMMFQHVSQQYSPH